MSKNEKHGQKSAWYQKIASFFYDPDQQRPRSLVRISAFVAVLFVAVVAATLVINFLLALIFSNEATDLESNGLLVVISVLQMLIMPMAVTFSLWVTAKYVDKRRLIDYGLKADRVWWLDFMTGFAVSAFMMAAVFGVQLAFGWTHVVSMVQNHLSPLSFGMGMVLQILSFIPIIFLEEIGIRGYLVKNIGEGFSNRGLQPWTVAMIGISFSSVVIAVSNAGNFSSNWLHLICFVLILIVFSLPMIVTGQLGATVGMHLGWLVIQGAVFGFNINGEPTSNSLLVTFSNGPDLLTGGRFGPLGGITGVAFSFAGFCLFRLIMKWSRRNISVPASLSDYRPMTELVNPQTLQETDKKD